MGILRTSCQLILLGLAVLQIAGGHLGIAQGYAWVKMVVAYSQTDGLREGITKTFDGEHPCQLCISIQEERERESDQPETPRSPSDQKLGPIVLTLSQERLQPVQDETEARSPVAWERALRTQWSAQPKGPPPRVLA